MSTPDPFKPISEHAKALASRAIAENEALKQRRATATGSEKKNLAGLRGIADSRSGNPKVNPFKIKVRAGFNARLFDTQDAIDDDAELVASIKEKGVQKPLTVDIGEDSTTLWLVDGERRLRATIRAINEGAKIEAVPVTTVPAGMDEADLIASQLTHNSGRRYNALELGEVVRKLIGYGWSHEKILKETATPIARQKESLSVLSLPVAAKELIRKGVGSTDIVKKTIERSETRQEGLKKLKEAQKVAAAAGRTRVLPRDLGDDRSKTDRAVVIDAFRRAEISRDVSGSVAVTFDGPDFDAMASRFGIKTGIV